ncbi:hypothetical protein, partial [Salmonella enterica]|uniref:hypothetical protein n=1 Tax=Salmonella enterica TaxID=28901 RepID=UPI0020C3BE80
FFFFFCCGGFFPPGFWLGGCLIYFLWAVFCFLHFFSWGFFLFFSAWFAFSFYGILFWFAVIGHCYCLIFGFV